MPDHDITRRDVLKATGGSLALAGVGGAASAGDSGVTEYNVGYSADAGRQAALDAASDVKREFNFDALTIRATDEAVQGLENRPDIRYVEENGSWGVLQTTPYGIEQVQATTAHDNGYTGNGADIAIIDTGIDSDHETLEANLGKGWAASNATCTEDCYRFYTTNGNTCHHEWDDDRNHGTHVAGTAAAADNGVGVVGVAHEATLHAVKVCDCASQCDWDDVAAGIEWTADQGYDVGNISLGDKSISSVVRDACQYATNKGVLLVAAAGNSGDCTDCVVSPADYDETVAVSGTDSNDDLYSDSSTGPEVEVAAPAVDVYSSVYDGYKYASGTSMASPHVAGAGGILMAQGNDNAQARQKIHDGADDVGLTDNEQGHGRLNVADSLGL